MYDTSVVKCIRCLDDVKEILEPACGHLRLTMHTNFCRNVISVEYMASAVIVVVFLKLQSHISTPKIMFFSKSHPQSQGYS